GRSGATIAPARAAVPAPTTAVAHCFGPYCPQDSLEGDHSMQGLMMDMPLLISSILKHAARHFGDVEIVSRRTEGDIHRTDYRTLERRARRLADALRRRGAQMGDRIGTLAWNNYRHMEMY